MPTTLQFSLSMLLSRFQCPVKTSAFVMMLLKKVSDTFCSLVLMRNLFSNEVPVDPGFSNKIKY